MHGTGRNKIINYNKIIYHVVEITNYADVKKIIEQVKPDEIYNLAAQSNVGISFKEPYSTIITNFIGSLNILEAVRQCHKTCHIFQASSIEVFGNTNNISCDENSALDAVSPYGESKLCALRLSRLYRNNYKIFVCNGILSNHESPIRPTSFITRLITKSVAEISLGKRTNFEIGNLHAYRDWGHAGDFVQAMWLMLQNDTPDDYILATGEIHSIKELIEEAFKCVDITLEWQGSGLDEIAINSQTKAILVKINPNFYRPTEPAKPNLDCTKAFSKLNWKPQITFSQLIKNMVENDKKTLEGHL